MTSRLSAVAVCALASLAAALPVSAASATSVRRGAHFGNRIFPDDAFTTADKSQLTGRRVNFRRGVDFPAVNGVVKRACTSANYSICDAFGQLNKLDGFDLQPRVTVPLTGAIKLDSVNDSNFFISDDRGAFASGMRQLTFDPSTNTLAGISDKFLVEGTRYRIHVTDGIRDAAGNAIDACGKECVVRFTTRTASAELVRIRQALDLPASDPNSAYAIAGVGDRKLSFTQDGKDDVFLQATLAPSVADPVNGIVRRDQKKADAGAPDAFESEAVPNIIPPGSAGYYAFGSFLSPRYQYASADGHQDAPYPTKAAAAKKPPRKKCKRRRRRHRTHRHGGRTAPVFTGRVVAKKRSKCRRARRRSKPVRAAAGPAYTDGEIPAVPSTKTPRPFGADRIGVIVVTPNPAIHPPPWPAAVYGPGFTRTKNDIFVTADYNASLGIVTLATDPAGHAYGAKSTLTVTSNGTPTTFLSYGRGRDLDGDGKIGDGLNDGVGPTGHFQADGSELPSHKPIDGLRSGLIQTVVDNMALGRAVKAGLDIPGVGTNLVDPSRIMYYGLSFGGIYGTMLMGTDPLFHRGLLNVPGGPVVDIARLSGFRNNLADTLKIARPNMLNGGPGLEGFTEDMPLRNDPPVVISHAGAGALQDLLATSNWYDRGGSPETFAPRIRLRPDPAWANDPKEIAFQTAYGDGTVPNPTAATLYRAGALFDRVVLYRNDKTPTFGDDPHGWLADPSLAGRESGEQQLGTFLSTGQLVNTNPAWLEVPIADPNNLECLHYPDPQTGKEQSRDPYPASGECPAPPVRAEATRGGR